MPVGRWTLRASLRQRETNPCQFVTPTTKERKTVSRSFPSFVLFRTYQKLCKNEDPINPVTELNLAVFFLSFDWSENGEPFFEI